MKNLPLGHTWERIKGDAGYKPDWIGIRRVDGKGAYIAETLKEDGSSVGIGFTSFTGSSVDELLWRIRLYWGDCCVILDLFVWGEQHSFIGEGI